MRQFPGVQFVNALGIELTSAQESQIRLARNLDFKNIVLAVLINSHYNLRMTNYALCYEKEKNRSEASR